MDDTPQPIYSSEQTPAPKAKTPFNIMMILISFFILIVGFSGGYYYASTTIVAPPIAIVPSPSSVPDIVKPGVDTSSWQYYTGGLNFEFKYPSDWTQSGNAITSPAGEMLSIVENQPGLDGPCPLKTNSEDVMVNGFPIKKEYYSVNTTNEDCQGSDVLWAVATIINDKDQIQLILTYKPAQKTTVLEQFNSIVESFTFNFSAANGTNPVYTPTLCQNEVLKIAIDTPNEFTCDSTTGEVSTMSLQSKHFNVTISDGGRGGPCPLYGDESVAATKCTKKQYYSSSSVTVDSYTEDGEIIAMFGYIGENDPSGITWIDINQKNGIGTLPEGSAANELQLLLDSIRTL